MSRLPFDPEKMRAAEAAARRRPAADPSSAAAPAGPTRAAIPPPLTVSRVAELVTLALRDHTPRRLSVIGEIGAINHRTHWYFTLKDEQATLSCVMFASAARRLGFHPRAGQQVVCDGRVEFYARQGRTQLYVDRMEPAGQGELERRYRALCEELRALGYFAAERKRPIPAFPRRIAIITSRTGAALQDVIDTARRRCPAVGLIILDVRVQGDVAAPSIVRALDRISRNHGRLGVDAVLLTRGGGSIEDLWAFNERTVAEAIVRCACPVIAAIGHETDTTIAELVADERCATPTQAAARLTPDRAALGDELGHLARRLRAHSERMVAHARQELRVAGMAAGAVRHLHAAHRSRLERLAARLAGARPHAMHALRAARLREAALRLAGAMAHRIAAGGDRTRRADPGPAARRALAARREHMASLARMLALTGPQAVLDRGFSLTTTADGAAVRDAGDIGPGTRIRTRVAQGSFESEVVTPDAPAPPDPVPPASATRKPRRRADDRGQTSLF